MTRARRLLPALALGVVLAGLAIDLWRHPEAIGIDFHTYDAAAQVGLRQGWSHIYDQALVAAEQTLLVPNQATQPFLSPPTVAWLVAPLTPLPYLWAFYVWAVVTFAAFVLALAWSAPSRGLSRWIAVVGATAAWWVLHAVHLGQVVPLVAAAVAVSWRLLREDRNVAAGLVLSLLLLKPNIAFVIPFAVLAAGRYRTFAALTASGAVLAVVAVLTLGTDGVAAYLGQLTGQLPPGADSLTLERALGVHGAAATALRLLIIATALVAAFRLRASPGLVLVAGILASLVAVPYLHASDLCLLAVAAWIVWEERPTPAWRLSLAAGWLVASPYAVISGLDLGLDRWPLLELVFLGGVVAIAWQVGRARPRDRVVGAS